MFELIINLKTAKAHGLTIPPSLLLRADHVIVIIPAAAKSRLLLEPLATPAVNSQSSDKLQASHSGSDGARDEFVTSLRRGIAKARREIRARWKSSAKNPDGPVR